MKGKHCQIVLVGHRPQKLILSIDKEIIHKVILITEKERLLGTEEASKTLKELMNYYQERRVETENIEFDFHIQTKPIAELIHLIYQQKLQGYEPITVNISGGLRYMGVWFYVACSITNTKVIHADFIYERREEVGINSNVELIIVPFRRLTDKQFEFLKLFFQNYESYKEFFEPNLLFNENSLLNNQITYSSLEGIRKVLEERRNESISRGSINGFIQKLNKISALTIFPNPEDKKERSITISYLGIAYFLNKLYKKNSRIKK